jgi:hypothetical protein
VTDVTSITICTSGTTSAATIYQDALLATAITQPITTGSANTTLTQATGSCSWYGPDGYDVTIISTTYGTIHLKGYSASDETIIIPTYWAASQSQTSTDAQSFTLGTDSDWVLAGGATQDRLTFTPATDGATFYIGSTARQADVYFWEAAASYTWWDESAGSLKFVGTEALFDDDSYAQFGTSADFTINYVGADDDLEIRGDDKVLDLGIDGAGFDTIIHSETASASVTFGEDELEELHANYDTRWDYDSIVYFGTDKGFSVKSATTTVLDILPLTTDETSTINFGANTQGVSINFFVGTSGDFVKLTGAASGNLGFEDVPISMGDATKILFGDALGTGDLYIESTSNVLTIGQVVSDTGTIVVGVDNAGIDMTWYGESLGAYMKYDATTADKLILNGIDSSGTLFGVTAIDTTGNSDTMTIDHSGTGDALQITCTTATAVALNALSAANQTTSIVKVDGATNNYIGADNIGALSVTGDTAGAHVGSTLVYVASSAQPIASGEGFLARFVDTGTARTTAHAVEIESTNTTPALGLNNQLTITGADSTGVLALITGIDTTGNSDSVQIAHSGTGDAVQITCTTATSVGLNLIGAAAQTTSVMKVDGATGADWRGAANVGMVHITSDGALADVAASLLYIANSGVPTNDSRGSSLRIVDTGNAAAGTAGYAVYISATDATVEALYIDDGKVLVDEEIVSNRGVQSASVAVTAADEASQATIPAGSRFVTITSDTATKVVCLPVGVVGNMITIYCAATGCELQTLAASNDTINGVDCDGGNEMVVTATNIYHLVCTADSTWVAYAWTAAGAAVATIVPDADA